MGEAEATVTRTFQLGHDVTLECASLIAEELRSCGVRASAAIDHHMVRNVCLVIVTAESEGLDAIIGTIQASIGTVVRNLDEIQLE